MRPISSRESSIFAVELFPSSISANASDEKDIQPNKKNRIVVVEFGRRSVGLLVNSASEVLKIPPADIEAPNDLFQDGEVDYVTGVAKLKGRLLIILDLEKVMRRSELRRLEDVADSVALQESEAIARR